MITVSTKRLIEAIEETEAFCLPKISAGTEYLYNNLYGRLSGGEDVSLFGLDFSAFELDDVVEIRDLYSGVLERGEHSAWNITRTLQGLLPVTTVSAFV